jgi:AbrB family looped-hinge helix DNA binding protein
MTALCLQSLLRLLHRDAQSRVAWRRLFPYIARTCKETIVPIASAKITSKGQVTLPAKLRRELGLKPGDRVEFERNESGQIEVVARTKSLADLKGMLPYDGPALSDDDLVAIVDDARAARAAELARQVPRARK